MERVTYLDLEYNGIDIKGACVIVNRNLLFVKMTSPYKASETTEITNCDLTETEEGVKEIFSLGGKTLLQLYKNIETVKANKEIFQSLWINFNNMMEMQVMKMKKKVFYSENERELYNRNMIEILKDSFAQLFDKYIQSRDKEVLALKESLHPLTLEKILTKVLTD